MNSNAVSMLKHWMEPAHPGVIRLHEDLLAIYQSIREKFQKEIDATFDRIAQKTGFVVTTSVPVVLEAKDGAVQAARMGAAHLEGTMFEEVLTPLRGLKAPQGATGSYNIYVVWFDALRLKLRTDWMEPAHFLSDRIISIIQQQAFDRTRPDIREPAHWFDPGIALSEQDAVQIAALDAVYPEFQLGKQVASYRDRLRATVTPGVREPAHFHIDPRQIVQAKSTAQ